MEFIFKVITNFVLQFICAEMIFFRSMKRRKYFFVRLLIALAVLIVSAIFIPKDLKVGWFDFYYFIQFSIALIFTWLCFDESPQRVIFFGVGTYAVQHLSFNFSILIMGLFKVPIFTASALGIVLLIVCFTLCYTACYFFFARRIKPGESFGRYGTQIRIVSAAIVAIVYVMSMRMVADHMMLHYGVIIYVMCCCVAALYIQFGLLESGKLVVEKEKMSHMLSEAEQQQRMAKDNIDFINIKCHDLKKQIAGLRAIDDKIVRDKNIDEIEKAVILYDSMAKSGNESLDIILTEKSIQCENRGIQFEYIIDGAKLNFMNPIDIYSMFENAIENAIESMATVEIAEKRILTLNVSAKAKLLSIHMENYMEKKLVFQDGIPITTKNDNIYHGFGLKSIRFIAEKYKGSMNITMGDDRFILDILLPIVEC